MSQLNFMLQFALSIFCVEVYKNNVALITNIEKIYFIIELYFYLLYLFDRFN